MTSRYLTGAYPGGYTLNTKYTGLVIDEGASVGGTGVAVGFVAMVDNLGAVQPAGRYTGVTLLDGGTVINGSAGDATAEIAAYDIGVRVDRASGTILNYGLLSSSGDVSIYLYDGGRVTNGAGGRISGFAYGIYASRHVTTVTNLGAIYSETAAAVFLRAGGAVTNGSASDTTASLVGEIGVGLTGLPATLANYGTIQGTSYGGVYLNSGGSFTNGSASDTGALIKAVSEGVGAAGAATVTNFGTITGAGGTAVALLSASGRLILEQSAAFVGSIVGGGGVLELAGGADAINGVGYAPLLTEASGNTDLSSIGAYVVDAGASLSLTGVNDLVAGKTLTNDGQVTVTEFLINRGVIQGAATSGLILGGGVTVINGSGGYTSALISGNDRGVYASASASVVNYATIKGAGGVEFYSGGGVTNGSATATTGLIDGVLVGVAIDGAPGTIANFATLQSQDGFAVYLSAGGRVTNGSAADHAALITGATGLYARGAATVTNFGTIAGAGGTAVKFRSAADVLVLEAGGVLTGLASGDGGTLEIGGGADTLTAPGTLTGAAPATFIGFAAYAIDAGASLTVTSGVSISLAGTVRDAGTLVAAGGAGFTDLDIAAAGVTLSGGGMVSLGAEGLIRGAGSGESLANLDTIVGGGFIDGPLALDNRAGGVIDASAGRMELKLGETLTNEGLIESTGPKGQLLLDATTIANSGAGAVVAGKQIILDGASLTGGALTIDAGAILSSRAASGTINLGAGTVWNLGTLEGATGGLTVAGAVASSGLLLADNGTLTLDGAVTGTGKGEVVGAGTLTLDGTFSEAVVFAAGATGKLVLGASAVFGGSVQGAANTVINDGLIQAAGASAQLIEKVVIDGAGGGGVLVTHELELDGATLTGGTVSISAGGKILAGATASVVNLGAATLTNAGILEGDDGGLTIVGTVANTGRLVAEGGALTITGAVSGSGEAEVAGAGRLELDGATAETIAFAAGATGRVILGDSWAYTGTLTGLSATGANSLDLKDILYKTTDKVVFVANANPATGGTLTVFDGTHTATLRLAGADYAKSSFILAKESGAGTGSLLTASTASVPAFAAAMASLATPGQAFASVAPGAGDVRSIPILTTPPGA